jgi:hypothetical protein
MAEPLPAFTRQAVPGEVWAPLPVAEQTRVIRLMARLAYHVVTQHVETPRREPPDGCTTDQCQTPA